jgi:N-acetylglucosamine-6-phosphate deacetylase
MPKKRHKPEEIVAKLRQVDVMVSQGQSVADAVRAIGVTEVFPAFMGIKSATFDYNQAYFHKRAKGVLGAVLLAHDRAESL